MHYDVHAMKTAGREAEPLVYEITRILDLLEAEVTGAGKDTGIDHKNRFISEERQFMNGLQQLRSVCNGYERLRRYMNAAANVYAMAQEAAAEQIDF